MDIEARDLEFTLQLSKQGLLQNTTKCCATGTCISVRSASIDIPYVDLTLDDESPEDLQRSFGSPV
jgi:hypothetical protein